MSYLKAENLRLKKRVNELEEKLVNLVGQIKIFSSGIESMGKQHELNNAIATLIMKPAAEEELKIVTPFVGHDYFLVLESQAKAGVSIQLIVNPRQAWPKKHQEVYDKLKATRNIELYGNPNVKYLLIWTKTEGIFSSVSLDKEELMNNILIGITILEPSKLGKLLEIYKEMLPSFMR